MQARLFKTASLIAAIAAPAITPASAQTPAEFYKGKSVTVLVGFSPGGGYDQYARMLIRHMGKHVPGAPDMIVQNLPGAGSLNAVRQLDATQAKDGTVIGTFNPGLITESLTDPARTKFNFAEVSWIGSITRDFRVCYVSPKLGIKNWNDFLAHKEIVFGATGKGTGNYVNGAILRNLFGANLKQVLGFPGSAEQRLAFERGEVDGDCGSLSSIPEEYLRDKKITPIVTFSPVEHPDMKGVPFLGTLAKTDEQKQVLAVLSAAGELGRPYIMSKAVPAARVEAMRKAFDETMKDSGFRAEAQKMNLPVDPILGADATSIITKIYASSPTIVAKAKEVIE